MEGKVNLTMNDSTTYDAWHRRLGHGEYRVRITMAGYGDSDDAAVALIEGLEATNGECGPVVSQNVTADTITATVALRAKDEENAVHLALNVFMEGGIASGLEPGDLVRVEAERVVSDDECETVTESRPGVPA